MIFSRYAADANEGDAIEFVSKFIDVMVEWGPKYLRMMPSPQVRVGGWREVASI